MRPSPQPAQEKQEEIQKEEISIEQFDKLDLRIGVYKAFGKG